MWSVGIDVGGTFTDLFAFSEKTSENRLAKVLTTRPDRSLGVLQAIEDSGISFSDIETLVHGSTTATNAVVERSYPQAAMICTKGFRDVIEIGRQRREDLFDPHWRRPETIIARKFRRTVPGRLGSDGAEIAAFDDEAARRLAGELRQEGVGSVAICFLNSYASDAHEVRMRDILLEEDPNCFVALSSHTSPRMREHARFTTTVIRAVLLPVMSDYFDRLSDGLKENGFSGNFLVLKSNGGMMGVDLARERPEELVESGPAGGVAYAQYLAEQSGFDNIIHTDMGGTTFDASIIEHGQGLITHNFEIQWEMPLNIPMLDIRSVGAGGGSIAWIDAGGSLRVGPRSAGSVPGPACYGRGGEDATVTDANLLLGRLEPSLGGKFELDFAAAEAAVAKVGEKVGLDPYETAEAIIAICSENMAQAIKLVLIDRGRDPRDFVLASFGGAGAMHACQIARAMSIPRVVVPIHAGVASAFGAVAMEVRHELEAFYYSRIHNADFGRLNELYDNLEKRGRQLLTRDSVNESDMTISRHAQMRYVGQSFEVITPIPEGKLATSGASDITTSFHKAHQTEHGVASPNFIPEFVGVGITASGRFASTPTIESAAASAGNTEKDRRRVRFDGEWQDTPIFSGEDLGTDASVAGPAIVEYPHSCAVLPPGTHATLDAQRNLVIAVPI